MLWELEACPTTPHPLHHTVVGQQTHSMAMEEYQGSAVNIDVVRCTPCLELHEKQIGVYHDVTCVYLCIIVITLLLLILYHYHITVQEEVCRKFRDVDMALAVDPTDCDFMA